MPKDMMISSLSLRLDMSDMHVLMENLSPQMKEFKKNQIILTSLSDDDVLGLILNGTAYLAGVNEGSDKRIIEYFENGDILGKYMLLNLKENVSYYYVIAKYSCTVAFIRYHKLLEYCSANISTTTHIMNYLLQGLEKRILMHVYILQQRTLREKILLYFHYLSAKYGANHFRIPIPIIDLADYLSVNRCALTRELAKLNEENIIKSDLRSITLLETGTDDDGSKNRVSF